MSLLRRLIPSISRKSFIPISDVNWTRIETLVHGPGASDRWEGGGDANSAAFACLLTLSTAYTEPPIRLIRLIDGKKEEINNSPIVNLLKKPTPNGELTFTRLMFWTGWAKHTDGNGYWIKVRSGNAVTGNVVQLWPVSPTLMRPITLTDRQDRALDWISHYEMQVAPNNWERVPKENVIHFRLGVDPQDMRLGLSPLKRLIREIASDTEADQFSQALLKNYAVPGLIVVPGQGDMIREEDGIRIGESISDKFGGHNRGKTAVLSKHGDIKQFGFSPKDLDLSSMHRIPEERIAAVIGIPAILAGLGAGLDRGTYSNARELRELFTEQKLVPEWRDNADQLNASLKPDFISDPDMMLEFDITDVRALQEDENDKYERLNLGLTGSRQWITVNEARADIGLPAVEGGDELQNSVIALPMSDETNREEEEEEDEELRKSIERKNENRLRSYVEARRGVRADVARRMAKDVDGWFADLADDLITQLAREDPAITRRGNGNGAAAVKAISRHTWEAVLTAIFDQREDELDELVKSHVIDVIQLTWPYLNLELNSVAQFNINDPAVVAALRQAGRNIKDIVETTRTAVSDYLQDAYRDGLPIEEIGQRVRGMVAETYKNRGEAIARTEIGMGQNTATNGRYKAAGVKYVRVFDNGFDNSHPFCRQVDGKTVTLDWMERNPLQHPNCVRAFGAVLDYDGMVFMEEQPWT